MWITQGYLALVKFTLILSVIIVAFAGIRALVIKDMKDFQEVYKSLGIVLLTTVFAPIVAFLLLFVIAYIGSLCY